MADRPSAPTDADFDADVPVPPPDAAADAAPDAAPPAGEADGAEAPDADALRAEVDALQGKLLRQAAEYQNYRRRSEGDRAEAVRTGRRDVLLPFLDVYDDLRRSLDAAQKAAAGGAGEGGAAAGALVEGVELVTQKFRDALARVGVEPIEAVGRPFSEDEHEAMMQQPSDAAASGTVLAEVQPGYRLGDRVLRHARVVVAE